jgi:hypothetical protein
MEAEDLTAEGMSRGVKESDVYVLFLSEGVMSRPFVHLELREAMQLEKVSDREIQFTPYTIYTIHYTLYSYAIQHTLYHTSYSHSGL